MNIEVKKVVITADTDYSLADSDILIVTPLQKIRDTPENARINVEFQSKFARESGKSIGLVVVMTNLLTQDAETRRIYAEMAIPSLFFGVALVVNNPLSRAIGSFYIGLSKPSVPTSLFDSVEKAVVWLRTIRPEENNESEH